MTCAGEMTDMGQITHGMVSEVRHHYGPSWPEHVAILNPEVLSRLDLLKMQGYPKLIFVPVQPDLQFKEILHVVPCCSRYDFEIKMFMLIHVATSLIAFV